MRNAKPADTRGRHILLITYHFPPSAAVGGRRIANFARWLSSFGWSPQVLTIPDENAELLDPERLSEIKGITVDHVPILPTLAMVYATAKNRFFPDGGSRSAMGPSPGVLPYGLHRSVHEPFIRRLKRYVLSFVVFPDLQRGWIIPATFAAIRKVRRQQIRWIMTSCPPYSVHLIGLLVKLVTRVRWVADFRDPWMTTGSKRTYPICALSVRLESWLERQVITRADLVLFNVERLRNAYRDRYSDLLAGKFVFIPNGVTPHGPVEGSTPMKYGVFTLAYTGSLYVGRSPEPIFEAISRLIQEGKTTLNGIRVKLVGYCQTVEGIPISVLIEKYNLRQVVEVSDSVPYSEALEIVRRSHLALLFAPQLPFQIPAKVYDYFGTGARILAIAEEGGTADLVRESGVGQAFPSDDIEGIKQFIYAEMTSPASVNGHCSAVLRRFDLRRITGELVTQLEQFD